MITINNIKNLVLLSLALISLESQAVLYQVGDRTQFNSYGSIAENYGFEDFGSGFSYPGDPWTEHGVTYGSGSNLIIGTGTFFSPVSNVFGYNGWSPVVGEVDSSPQYSMFAVDLGILGINSSITISIMTNLGIYELSGINVQNASLGLDFYGFMVDVGEYITGFDIASLLGPGSGPVIDNVTLGSAALLPQILGLSAISLPEPQLIGFYVIFILWVFGHVRRRSGKMSD